MKPIVTQETNVNLVAEDCFDLPAHHEVTENTENSEFFQSVWELTTDELIQIMNTGKIALTIWGGKHPPVRLEVLE